MCLPFSRAIEKLKSITKKQKTAPTTVYNNEKTIDFDSSTTVAVSNSNYSSANCSLEKLPQFPAVRKIGMKEHKAAAASLAKAFKDDEVSFYFLTTPKDSKKSPKKIWKLHTKIMEYTVAAHCRKGLVLSIGENHEGVALWMPPGQNMDDWWTIFRSGMWKLKFKLSSEGRKRWFDEFLPKLHDCK